LSPFCKPVTFIAVLMVFLDAAPLGGTSHFNGRRVLVADANRRNQPHATGAGIDDRSRIWFSDFLGEVGSIMAEIATAMFAMFGGLLFAPHVLGGTSCFWIIAYIRSNPGTFATPTTRRSGTTFDRDGLTLPLHSNEAFIVLSVHGLLPVALLVPQLRCGSGPGSHPRC